MNIMDEDKIQQSLVNEERALKTIQEQRSEEERTIQKIVSTSPVQIVRKGIHNSNTKQHDIRSLSQKQKLFSHSSKNKSMISHPIENQKYRHRRNKTEMEVKDKIRSRDPVYSCLFVPFLQTKGFGFKKAGNGSTHLKSNSVQKQKQRFPSSLQAESASEQKSLRQRQKYTQKLRRVSLPEINKKTLAKEMYDLKLKQQRKSLLHNQTEATVRQAKEVKQIKKESKNPMNLIIDHPKAPALNVQKPFHKIDYAKNLKQFKLQERQNKLSTRKKGKKIEQWTEINFLQLKTCYYHCQKTKSNTVGTGNSIDTSFVQNKLERLTEAGQKNTKLQSILSSRIPKILKLPNTIQEASLFIKNYSSKRSLKVSIDQLVRSRNFTVKFIQKDMLYFGEVNNQIFDGYGIVLKDDYLFQGTWKSGQKVSGSQVKKGIFYEGGFLQNKKQGFGISYWNNGFDQYSGQWKNGQKHGNGVWKNLNGDHYVGQWINGKVDGFGVHTTKDGQRYQGYFFNFLKHGKGKQTFPNQDVYEGNFSEGKPEGFGVYKFHRSNVTFEGEFSNGLRNGKGKLLVPHLFTYQGQFTNDSVTGYGKLNYLNNDTYIGNFKQGTRHGYGSFQNFKQNKILNGLWKNGQFQVKAIQQNSVKK